MKRPEHIVAWSQRRSSKVILLYGAVRFNSTVVITGRVIEEGKGGLRDDSLEIESLFINSRVTKQVGDVGLGRVSVSSG